MFSTQSTTSYEWSVKLIGTAHFAVGIASKLIRDRFIYDFDEEAVLFYANGSSTDITRGSTIIHSSLKIVNSGDVINFKFEPDTKKLIIDRVRNKKYSSINFTYN